MIKFQGNYDEIEEIKDYRENIQEIPKKVRNSCLYTYRRKLKVRDGNLYFFGKKKENKRLFVPDDKKFNLIN